MSTCVHSGRQILSVCPVTGDVNLKLGSGGLPGGSGRHLTLFVIKSSLQGDAWRLLLWVSIWYAFMRMATRGSLNSLGFSAGVTHGVHQLLWGKEKVG